MPRSFKTKYIIPVLFVVFVVFGMGFYHSLLSYHSISEFRLTKSPTMHTFEPTKVTLLPSMNPSNTPSESPTIEPTKDTKNPTGNPSNIPTENTDLPTFVPTYIPSNMPTKNPNANTIHFWNDISNDFTPLLNSDTNMDVKLNLIIDGICSERIEFDIKRLITNINDFTIKPDRILFIVFEWNNNICNKGNIYNIIQNSNIQMNIKFSDVNNTLINTQNLVIEYMEIQGYNENEWLMFYNSKDIINLNKIEIMRYIINMYNIDGIIHGYIYKDYCDINTIIDHISEHIDLSNIFYNSNVYNFKNDIDRFIKLTGNIKSISKYIKYNYSNKRRYSYVLTWDNIINGINSIKNNNNNIFNYDVSFNWKTIKYNVYKLYGSNNNILNNIIFNDYDLINIDYPLGIYCNIFSNIVTTKNV